jgi:hypothetical protein
LERGAAITEMLLKFWSAFPLTIAKNGVNNNKIML